MNKNKKTLIIIVVSILVLTGVFFFPKSMDSCGEVSDGWQCVTYNCLGIQSSENFIPPRINCIGIDLGNSESFFESIE